MTTAVGAASAIGLERIGATRAHETNAGEEMWRFETEDNVFSSPTVVDGTVYVGSWYKQEYCDIRS